MIASLARLPARVLLATALLGLALATAPLVVDGYILSVILIALYFAYVGQAWNIVMGYAGQLSLGHALYVGLGAYMAAALYIHAGIPPILGVFPAVAGAALAAAIIGALAFRFRIGGVYFALLTIAFAEFTRILFMHIDWLGATEGLFLPVENRTTNDLLNLRGSPTMFYYVLLSLVVASVALAYYLRESRLGFFLRAVREDEDAAEASGINIFRVKMIAVVLSGAMTSVGGVILAFYYNNLFPSDVFGMHRSIEIILAPIVGGLGTLFGPLIGAFALGILGEGLTAVLEASGTSTAGIKQLVYAAMLIVIIKFLPGGLWPSIARLIRLDRGGER
ncbi:branched-chain amino acid ABC transporter permease [Oceanibacterium hippocampi]|uniref:Ribose transport system permease protein RbsC n=1 Tax=Oceanibacterium hippocampi TaxID=745714 RepID=A0A1Y5R8J3_9PROT|nr:branched-chain amino acid ABC transporter permease [Oceanibacterium hippocampi]SLN10530.1 Ribose transport system permease protein RbsC [Oceanibacterium hippocampi]